MTPLVDALRALGLTGEVRLSGHWVELQGERCPVYVVAALRGPHYYTWCDDPAERTVEHYGDPIEAIQAGLRRAARRGSAERDDG